MRRLSLLTVLLLLGACAAPHKPDPIFETALMGNPPPGSVTLQKVRDDGLPFYAPSGWTLSSEQVENKQMPGGMVISTYTLIRLTREENECQIYYMNERKSYDERPGPLKNNAAMAYARGDAARSAIGSLVISGDEVAYARVPEQDPEFQMLRFYGHRDLRRVFLTCRLRAPDGLGTKDSRAVREAYQIIHAGIAP